MPTIHPAERNITAGMVGGLMFGVDQSMLVDADLATSIAAAKAAVDLDNAKLHTSQKTFGGRIKASLDMVDNYDTTYKTGSDADKSTMLAYANPPYRGRQLAY